MNEKILEEIKKMPYTTNVRLLYQSSKFFELMSYRTFLRYYKKTHPSKKKQTLPTISYLHQVWAVDFINLKRIKAKARVKRTFTTNIKILHFTYFLHNKPIKVFYYIFKYPTHLEDFKLMIEIARKLGIEKLVVDRQVPLYIIPKDIQIFLWKGKHKSPIEYFGFAQKLIYSNRELKNRIERNLDNLSNLINIIHTIFISYFKSIPIINLNHLL